MISVMLIDDHPVVRAGLRSILDSFDDIEVIAEGSDGTDALEANADVLVMDIQMPGMNGIEATKRVDIPVLILTTYDSQADIIAAVEAGAMGYLLKDAPEQELHDAVVATAQRRRTLSAGVANALAERVGNPAEALSKREIEIVRALATGASNQEVADELFISLATVKTHLLHVYQKLGVDNRTSAVRVATERRLI